MRNKHIVLRKMNCKCALIHRGRFQVRRVRQTTQFLLSHHQPLQILVLDHQCRYHHLWILSQVLKSYRFCQLGLYNSIITFQVQRMQNSWVRELSHMPALLGYYVLLSPFASFVLTQNSFLSSCSSFYFLIFYFQFKSFENKLKLFK